MSTRNAYTASLVLGAALLAFGFAAYGHADSEIRGGDVRARDTSERITERQNGRGTLPPRYSREEIVVKFKGESTFRRVPVGAGETPEAAIARFGGRNDVAYAEPNYEAVAFFTPNDPYYQFQWHLSNGVYGGIEAERAWDVATGSGVVVAIVDTGIAYENYQRSWKEKYYIAPDLAGTSFVPGYDFVNDDTHANDDNGHGTHVAGTVAQSTDNSLGIAGVAFNATLMPVKVLGKNGSGNYADVADGIRYAADNGADIITLSLGGPSPTTYLEEAVKYAHDKGVLVIAATGNDGIGSVAYPAAYDDYVVAVGATRFDETRSYYSNYGASVDLVAPGGDMGVDQNKDGYGDGVLQQTFGNKTNDWGYYFFQGTSMATPHVAGVAALVLAHGNTANVFELRSALEESADDLGPAGRDSEYGWGLVNAFAALNWTPDSETSEDPPPAEEPPVNNPPTADAGVDQSGFVGDTIVFDGSGSFDSDGSVVDYSWNFGDGFAGAGTIVNHSYNTAGAYTITLTVTDNGGLTAQDTATVNISEVPSATVDVVHIIGAKYSPRGGGRLDVEATSSEGGVAVLTVEGFGTMSYRAGNDIYTLRVSRTGNPGTVTVTSSLGGTDSTAVSTGR
jgi:serine protease